MTKCDWDSWLTKSIEYYGSFIEFVRQHDRYRHTFYPWIFGYCKPPMTVLEAGCGVGLVACIMAGMGYDVMGVDCVPSAIKFSKEVTQAKCGTHAKFECKDIMKMDDSKKFDLVMSLGVLEHFSEKDALEMVKKLMRLSNKFIMLEVPTKNTPLDDKDDAPMEIVYYPEKFVSLCRRAGIDILNVYAWGESVAVMGLVP